MLLDLAANIVRQRHKTRREARHATGEGSPKVCERWILTIDDEWSFPHIPESCGPPHCRLSIRPEPLPSCANRSQLPDLRIEHGCRVYQEVICGQATEKLMNGRGNDTAGP